MSWKALDRLNILYRAGKLLMDMPQELRSMIFKENLNCGQAHNFISTYFADGNNIRKVIDDKIIDVEEQTWKEIGNIYFNKNDITTSEDFARECSYNNPQLSEILYEIIIKIIQCCNDIYENCGDSGPEMNILQELNSSFERVGSEEDSLSIRMFIVNNKVALQQIVTSACELVIEKEEETQFLERMEQADEFSISRFEYMFRTDTDLNSRFTDEEEEGYSFYEHVKRLTMKIISNSIEFPTLIENIDDLLVKNENDLLASHLYLYENWFDQVNIIHEDGVLDESSDDILKISHILGYLLMCYIDHYEQINDEDWLIDEYLLDGKEELKQSFREGRIVNGLPSFNFSYVKDRFKNEASLWYYICLGLNSKPEPPPFFIENIHLTDDIIDRFNISIRLDTLFKWFSSRILV
jgi:hypothetical protein